MGFKRRIKGQNAVVKLGPGGFLINAEGSYTIAAIDEAQGHEYSIYFTEDFMRQKRWETFQNEHRRLLFCINAEDNGVSAFLARDAVNRQIIEAGVKMKELTKEEELALEKKRNKELREKLKEFQVLSKELRARVPDNLLGYLDDFRVEACVNIAGS